MKVLVTGATSFVGSSIVRELLYSLNVRRVETVLGAALAAGVKRAVHTSSVAAMGGTRTPEVRDKQSPSFAEKSVAGGGSENRTFR